MTKYKKKPAGSAERPGLRFPLVICTLRAMNRTEYLKKQLAELAEVINGFSSQAVQLIVIDRVLSQLEDGGPGEHIVPIVRTPKRNGATKILNRLLESGFFDTERSISELAGFCAAHYDGPFYTNQLSGLLLSMVNKGTLLRTISPETNRYVYTSTAAH
jgi:hypothetical protein